MTVWKKAVSQMSTRAFLCGVVFLAALSASGPIFGAPLSIERTPGDLPAAGNLDFPVSCSAGLQPEFNRGVGLLASFFSEEPRRIFTAGLS